MRGLKGYLATAFMMINLNLSRCFIHDHALYWKVFFFPSTLSQYFLFIRDSKIYLIILGFAALSSLVFGSFVK